MKAVILLLSTLFLLLSTTNLLSLSPLEEEAKRLYYQGELEESRDLFLSLLQSEEHTSYYLDLALIYRELGEHQKALNSLYQLTTLEPTKPWYWRELGTLYYSIGEYYSSFRALQESLILEPHREAYYYSGLILKEDQDYSRAIKALEMALELDPTFALAHFQLATLYDFLQEIDKAIQHYLLALRYDGSMTEIHTLLGERYLELGDLSLAYERFKRAVLVNPNPLNQARLQEMEERFPKLIQEREETPPEDLWEVTWMRPESIPPLTEDTPKLRVMLLEDVEKLNLMTAGPFYIREGRGGEILGEGEGEKRWKVKKREGGFTLFKEEEEYSTDHSLYLDLIDPRDPFLLFHVLYGHGYFWAGMENRQYRGDLEIRMIGDKVAIINHLHLEEYLYSVVPSEMPASWPLEGLKAQAVAARSYTLRRLGGEHYDLCSTVRSAVYRGLIAEHPRSRAAVDATRGQVLTHGGSIIDAVYSSNVGGHTHSSAETWGGERHYLQPVSTDLQPREPILSPGELKAWLMESPPSFSNQSPYVGPNQYRWVRSFHIEDLEKKYSNLGRIEAIRVLSRGEGGLVLSLAIIGEEGERIFRGDAIRSAFNNLRSNLFIIESIFHEEGSLKEIILYGGGFGHGVGMGQTEAAAMARQGYSYLEILHFFYQDVEEVRLY